MFVQLEKRVSRSTSRAIGFNLRQVLFTARSIDLLIPFGHSPPVFPDVHPVHPSSSGTDVGSQSIEPGDRNDEPRRPGTYFNYEVFESHILATQPIPSLQSTPTLGGFPRRNRGSASRSPISFRTWSPASPTTSSLRDRFTPCLISGFHRWGNSYGMASFRGRR